jgi:hypothetical protein
MPRGVPIDSGPLSKLSQRHVHNDKDKGVRLQTWLPEVQSSVLAIISRIDLVTASSQQVDSSKCPLARLRITTGERH